MLRERFVNWSVSLPRTCHLRVEKVTDDGLLHRELV